MNSTHVYDKLDIELSASDFQLLVDHKKKPVAEFFKVLQIDG